MQLITDLNQWNIIDFDNMIDIAEKSWGSVEQKHTAAFCHYQIIDNEVLFSHFNFIIIFIKRFCFIEK